MPKGSDVVASAAPSHDHANPEWPCRSLHGAKWSDGHGGSEADLLRLLDGSEEGGGVELFVGRVEADLGHRCLPSRSALVACRALVRSAAC